MTDVSGTRGLSLLPAATDAERTNGIVASLLNEEWNRWRF